jgi:hypothetical protein
MRARVFVRLAVLLLSLGPLDLIAGAAGTPQTPSINQRPTVARVRIAGSPKLRDGSYALTGTSGVCGEIPKEASLTGQATFVVEFPNDGSPNDPINAISFGSSQLVGGVTKASVFRLQVNVRTANGGRPPAYVLNTDSPNPKNRGEATLTVKGTTVTLRVTGQEVMGETIDLEVTCM